MTNGDRIRQMSNKEINDILKHEIIYPVFTISDVRQANNKILALMLNGCCEHCSYKNQFVCSEKCVHGILDYLYSEVE